VSILAKIFGNGGQDRAQLQPLYAAIVAAARRPEWYVSGKVADTLDGRFDMVAAMMSLVLLRLEAEGKQHATENALLTEIFVNDMDGQLREIGIGDVVVGKHLGRMVSALGGRLGAYRDAFAVAGDINGALERNLYRGVNPGPEALQWSVNRMRTLYTAILALPSNAILEGHWPDI